jgi:subtilisin family serine protease
MSHRHACSCTYYTGNSYSLTFFQIPFIINYYRMQKISTLLLVGAMCFAVSNLFAQRYFRIDNGKQINFKTSGDRFITTAAEPVSITTPYNLSPGLTIESTVSLGQTGFALLQVQQKATVTAGQLHKAGRSSGRFRYITPVLLTEEGQEIGALTDRIMVKLKNNVAINQMTELISAAGATIVKKYEFDQHVYFVQLPADSVNFACEIAWRFFQTGLFQYAEPDYLLFIKKSTNDPFYNNQWSLNNTRQTGGTAGADIKAVQAWGITTGCDNIRVAVIDDGVQLNHPDLQAHLLPGFDATGGGSAGSPTGNDAHGTACAGIIGAIADNGIGVAGIAFNSRLLPIRGYTGTSTIYDITTAGWLANAIDWAWQNGADVISCSWHIAVGQAAIQQAITNAVTSGRGGLGTVICVASGNENVSTISFPSSVPAVIAVGASSPCDQRKSPSSCDGENWGSNYGTGLDVVAPGVKIYTTDLQGANGYNTSGDYFANFNGTSSATPHVAATVALILSANATLTGLQARQLLESTTDKVGGYSYTTVAGQANGTWNNEMGYGRINTFRALQGATGIAMTGPESFCSTANYTISNLPANTDVTWTVHAGRLRINSGQHTPTVNITGLTRGSNTLQASYATACGTVVLMRTIVVLDVPIIVGGYYNSKGSQVPLSETSVNNVCLVGRPTNMITNMEIMNNPTSVKWEFDYITQGLIWGQSGNNLTLTFRAIQHGDFLITATNSCGTSSKFYSFQSVSCPSAATVQANDYNVQVSPNPVAGMLRITTKSTYQEDAAARKNTTARQGAAEGVRTVRIYDLAGRLVKKLEYTNMPQQVAVNTADIYPGVYIIEIFNGASSSRQKVVIQK